MRDAMLKSAAPFLAVCAMLANLETASAGDKPQPGSQNDGASSYGTGEASRATSADEKPATKEGPGGSSSYGTGEASRATSAEEKSGK